MKSICNFGYARTKKGGAYFPDVRGLLKYIQYRDDHDDHIPGGGGKPAVGHARQAEAEIGAVAGHHGHDAAACDPLGGFQGGLAGGHT